jgi:hypothetical protein
VRAIVNGLGFTKGLTVTYKIKINEPKGKKGTSSIMIAVTDEPPVKTRKRARKGSGKAQRRMKVTRTAPLDAHYFVFHFEKQEKM